MLAPRKSKAVIRHDVAVKDAKPATAAKPQPAAPVTIARSAGAAVKPRYFEFAEDTSSKFWEVSQACSTMTTRWGPIGSAGQSKAKTFADEQAAANAMAVLIKEKTDEGYLEREW
jgi:DNA ligase 1